MPARVNSAVTALADAARNPGSCRQAGNDLRRGGRSFATPYLIRCEERTAAGRADAVVETADSVYVFEFKLDANGTAEDALKQIDDKGYLVPYAVTKKADGTPKNLYKIGVAFDAEKRTIGEWIVK